MAVSGRCKHANKRIITPRERRGATRPAPSIPRDPKAYRGGIGCRARGVWQRPLALSRLRGRVHASVVELRIEVELEIRRFGGAGRRGVPGVTWYGSAMVKACVDRDIEAYQALQSYPSEYSEMVDRCERDMGTYGWSMVKACADRDIEAERALGNMIKRQ